MSAYLDSHAGDGRLANAVDNLIVEAGGRCSVPINVIAERRQFIMDVARCRYCGTSGKECDRTRRDGAVGCCISDFLQGCRHVEDRTMVDALMREIMAGTVHTVAEAYPPPVQGPKMPGYAWLLGQREWWYPYRRPAVRVASMDKPWRFNTARYLERQAALHLAVGSRYLHDAPDDVWASWEAESPAEWLREQPLMRALTKGLPGPDTMKGRALAARAVHWNTCPMRKSHPGALDHCLCIRDGRGRVVGASNDAESIRRAGFTDHTVDEVWDMINGRVPDRVWSRIDGQGEEWRLP